MTRIGHVGGSEYQLFLSDAETAHCHQQRQKHFIDSVISVSECRQEWVMDGALDVMVCDVPDHPKINLEAFFPEVSAFLKQQLSQGNVLIHCSAGISRSASLVLLFLMKERTWSFETAYHWLKQRRPIIDPNTGFRRQLLAADFQHLSVLDHHPDQSDHSDPWGLARLFDEANIQNFIST